MSRTADKILEELSDIAVEIRQRNGYWDRHQQEIDYLQAAIDKQLKRQTEESRTIVGLEASRELLKAELKGLL